MHAGFSSALLLVLAARLVAAAPAPARPAAKPAPASAASLESAIRAFDAGDYQRAVGLLHALPPDVGSGPEARFYLGYSELRLEHFAEALEAVDAALALEPDDLRAVYLRALARLRLGRPGAEDDFTRVREALPDAPIGRSSAEYLAELAAARERAAAAAEAAAATAGSTAAVSDAAPAGPHPPGAVGPGDLGTAPSPWSLRLGGRLSVDVDSNPGLAPDVGGTTMGADPRATSAARLAPALSLALRSDVARTFGPELSLSAGLSAFQRLYAPAGNAVGSSLRDEGGTGGPRDPGGTMRDPGAAGGLDASAGQTGTDNDLSDLALELAADWRPGGVAVRGGYRGDLVLYGFAPAAHEHTGWARLTWPSASVLSATLRLSATTLQPLDSAYDHLRGVGASARPVVSLLLLGGDLLLEGGWGVETYRAADYRASSTAGGVAHDVFFSYSYDGHGPELYVSWLGPWQLHLVAWGSTSFRTYRDPDTWDESMPGTGGMTDTRSAWQLRTQLRRDTRWLAGARASVGFRERGELFLEASYLDNRSSLDSPGDDRDVRRLLISVGVQWR